MPSITFGDSQITLNEQETVLDALLRTGHDIANGCRAGACQSCLLITDNVKLPSAATSGLSESQKSLGVFKSCSFIPTDDVIVKTADELIQRVRASVIEKTILNASVIRIRLKAELDYFPGQYVSLWKGNHLVRSYSIASVPELDNYIEFHLKHYPEGQFSHWVYDEVEEGTVMEVQGPMGNCFYTLPEQPVNLLLLASGTGLAPLYGILREALHKKHQGNIKLLFAARTESDFYYLDELSELASTNKQFSYELITMDKGSDKSTQADIYEYIKTQYSDLKGFRVYICGAGSFVQKLKKQCFLAGANMNEIFTDSFISFSG